MKTDTVEAWQVDEGDYLNLGSEDSFEVKEVHDNITSIAIVVVDDDGERETFEFKADETVAIVVSFEDDEADPDA